MNLSIREYTYIKVDYFLKLGTELLIAFKRHRRRLTANQERYGNHSVVQISFDTSFNYNSVQVLT